jgi:hypothetical protein
MAKVARPVIDRLLEKLDISDGCWEWQGQRDSNGYGRITVGSRTDGSITNSYVHIQVWIHTVGAVPEGLVLDHVVCDNPACANPDHLEPKSRWANVARSATAATAINARKTECINGHPFDEGNTRYLKSGARACRTCGREAMRRWRAAQHRR